MRSGRDPGHVRLRESKALRPDPDSKNSQSIHDVDTLKLPSAVFIVEPHPTFEIPAQPQLPDMPEMITKTRLYWLKSTSLSAARMAASRIEGYWSQV